MDRVRRILSFPCEGETLFATLDGPAEADTGWLFVTGGTQTRVGPHRLYERLASRLAAAGDAVLRFDRRGTGDSTGTDPGYRGSGPDLAAAVARLRAERPHLRRLLGFGLCDGATALALSRDALGVNALLLANPWIVERADDLPAPAAIRAHYRRQLADPAAWRALAAGRIDWRRLVRGLRRSAAATDMSLAARFAAGMRSQDRLLLARHDGTAQAFLAAWRALGSDAPAAAIEMVGTASHSFAPPAAFDALAAALLALTRRR